MDLPRIAERSPANVNLEAGKRYAFCTCGLSANQPFCDGQHRGTGFAPVVFTAEQTEEAWLCRCKRTGTAPRCDGTHNHLESE